MSVESKIAGFLRVAHEDLAGARLLAAANNRNAIYLCEQAAEKLIKAVLTSEACTSASSTTSMRSSTSSPTTTRSSPGCERSSISPPTRPPTAIPTDDGKVRRARREHRVGDAIVAVEAVLLAVVARFDVDLDHPDAPARRPVPIR
ncbi:hypothetical protein [Nannocystis punicea]|uniref:HEPN domain-containing protein n=1 Tax=Nannocystis punicea TaxID=2995304 RepID=A0ABY7H0G5_9BACT|nr:hypothetical protein [Nannocystis poenicansa]WAS92514.1 hypothetical protein O0S08_40560 [Nannocystis poenicansa]